MENLLRDNKEKLFCWIDVETENLGLHEQLNKSWQVSWAMYRNNKIEQTFDFYVKWPEGLNVSPGAAKTTHFEPEKIEKFGVPPEEMLNALDKCLRAADFIAGHNLLGFEAYQIPILYRKLGREPYNIVPKAFDTFAIAKAVKKEIPYNPKEDFVAWQYRLLHKIEKGLKTSIGALAKEFEIKHDPNQLHSAAYDVWINIEIWNKLKYMINLKND